MFKIALQSLLARKLRLVTTALAVILGVAFTAGTLVLTDTMSNIFNNLSASVYQGTDALVRAKAVFNGPNQMGEQRPNIDESLVPALSHVPGVAAAAGSAFGYARLIGKDGKPIGNPGNGAPTLGGNWGSVPALNPFHLVAGHAPQAPDEVVIDKQSATTGHLKVGDTTTVIANGPPLRVRIAGIVGFGTADNLAGASVVLFTTPVAQRLVAEALAVGVIAALLGLAAGVAVAAGLKALLSVLGLSLPAGGLVVNARTVVASLLIGVGLIAFISIFASSAKASINATIDRTFAGDFVINSGAGSSGGVAPALAQRLNTLPQVAAATGERTGSMLILGQPTMIAAVDPRTAGQIFNVSPVQGSIGALGADGIAVYKDDATKHHLTLGSPVSVVFRDTGPKTLRVALIYGDNQAAPSANPGSKTSYFLGTPGYDANFAAPHFDTQVFVKKAPGVSTAAALAAVKTVAAQYAPGTTVQDQAAYKAEQTKGINQVLALIYTLLALVIVIALLGIGNTLALSIFERTRELGVMRAVGMTRRQLRGTIRWESVIIALQGTLLGLLVGVFFGWALVRAQKSNGISVFNVPWLTLVIMVLLAGLAGVVAAILPSRRAAKLNVLRAIVTE